jgi:pimeloyl-ACP methyl ester carboxylesterase
MRLRTLLGPVVLALALAGGCAVLLSAPTPMRTLRRSAVSGHTSRCVVVFLPGLGDDERDFDKHGFVDALGTRNLEVDTVAANATIGYYAKRTVLERLREDVIRPVRLSGYQQIWLVGISLGGLGSLLLAKDQESTIAGVYLLAPYLGEEDLLSEIDRAGGLRAWEPGAAKDDYRELWRWLKDATAHPDQHPAIFLGAGDQDKLAHGHRLLRAVLPPDRVFRTNGIHDWGPWSVLWADFLDHSDFRSRCEGP